MNAREIVEKSLREYIEYNVEAYECDPVELEDKISMGALTEEHLTGAKIAMTIEDGKVVWIDRKTSPFDWGARK